MSIALILVLIFGVIGIAYYIWLWLVQYQERKDQKLAEKCLFEIETEDGEKAILITGYFSAEEKEARGGKDKS